MELIGQLILFAMVIAGVWAGFSWINVNDNGTPMSPTGKKSRSRKSPIKNHSHKK